jgi:hypothetical protein
MLNIANAHSTALKFVLTVVVLGLLVRAVGWRDLLSRLAAARWSWLEAMYGVAWSTSA